MADPEVADPVVDPRDKSKDRLLEVSGNQPSPHNMKWYSDLNAPQRYSVIIAAYLQVAAAIDSREPAAMERTVDDMSLWVIGNAPADQEAIRAGREYYQDVPGFMNRVHSPIFGQGYSDFYAFESPNIPRIPELPEGSEVSDYSSRMLQELSDDPGRPRTFNYQYDFGKIGNLFMEGLRSAPEEVGGLMDSLSIDPERNNQDSWLLNSVETVDEPSFFQPKADDLFSASVSASHGPEYSVAGQNAKNLAGNVPGLALDAVIFGGAARIALGGAGNIGQAGVKALPSGPRAWVTNALTWAKGLRGEKPAGSASAPRLSTRQKIAGGNLAFAGTTSLAAWGRDWYNRGGIDDISGLTPETKDWLQEVYRSEDGVATNLLHKATDAVELERQGGPS